ncbi:MAG TPA: hypothetical protein VK968_00480, partial [Roseimicrobium sp.]|nr:hypothetical protein [Roseimicrobium sp.]
ASLVLTENTNPFVIPSLVSGALVVGFSVWLTPRFDVWGMIMASGFVQAGFNNWWPVVRAVAGLHPVTSGQYWKMFFGFPRHSITSK